MSLYICFSRVFFRSLSFILSLFHFCKLIDKLVRRLIFCLKNTVWWLPHHLHCGKIVFKKIALILNLHARTHTHTTSFCCSNWNPKLAEQNKKTKYTIQLEFPLLLLMNDGMDFDFAFDLDLLQKNRTLSYVHRTVFLRLLVQLVLSKFDNCIHLDWSLHSYTVANYWSLPKLHRLHQSENDDSFIFKYFFSIFIVIQTSINLLNSLINLRLYQMDISSLCYLERSNVDWLVIMVALCPNSQCHSMRLANKISVQWTYHKHAKNRPTDFHQLIN